MHCGKRQAPSTNQPTNVVGSQYPPMKRDFIACGNADATCVLHVLGTGVYISACLFMSRMDFLFLCFWTASCIYYHQQYKLTEWLGFLLVFCKKKNLFFFFFLQIPCITFASLLHVCIWSCLWTVWHCSVRVVCYYSLLQC